MENQIVRVATWNIGGGILGKSHQIDGQPVIDYHASVLRTVSADIVCLQEAHVYQNGFNQVAHLAQLCGYEYSHTQPISPSHLAEDAQLSLGILSKHPIGPVTYTRFPNPGLTNTGPNGEHWILFDKGFTFCEIETPAQHIQLLHAHCFPLHYFGVNATDPQLDYVWAPLKTRLAELKDLPTVACIDLNSPDIDGLLPALRDQGYSECYRRGATTPKGIQQDFILKSRLFPSPLESRVQPTEGDHAICSVSFTLV
jgi:endonuclease/exonuclease/phosphatase family metal-dependent hydrolase